MRILVADDNAQLGLLYRAVLEDAGYEVVVASSGIAAIGIAESQPIDAAVLDVLMPGLSGDAIAERIHAVRPTLPVLLITGAYGREFAAAAGAPVLRKPFAPEELVRAVRELVG